MLSITPMIPTELMEKTRMIRRSLLALLAAVPVLAAVAGCGGPAAESSASTGGSSGQTKLSLVAYSTPREAYVDLFPAFQKSAVG